MYKVEEDINLLQTNLEMLRKLFGWSAEQLGNRLGLTKQTVLNLEHGKATMSRVQYIAIRAVFEAELKRREEEEKKNLLTVMNLMFDTTSKMTEQDRNKMMENAKVIANASSSTKDKKMLTNTLSSLLAATGSLISGAVVGACLNAWLNDMLVEEKEKQDK